MVPCSSLLLPSIFSYFQPTTNQCQGRQEYTLDRSPVHHLAHKSLIDGGGDFELPITNVFGLSGETWRTHIEFHSQRLFKQSCRQLRSLKSLCASEYLKCTRLHLNATTKRRWRRYLAPPFSILYFGYTGITTDWIRDYEWGTHTDLVQQQRICFLNKSVADRTTGEVFRKANALNQKKERGKAKMWSRPLRNWPFHRRMRNVKRLWSFFF